jgi:glucose/arabinose dehydrogenase
VSGVKLAAALMAACAVAAPLAGAKVLRRSLATPIAKSTQLDFRLFASGLRGAWFIGAPRSEPNRLYVVQKGGRIRVLVNGRLRRQAFLDIRGLVGSPGPEQGLFSIAFHPGYARNHRFYVVFIDNDGDMRVVEYRSNGARAVRRLRQVLLVRQPSSRNGGGQLQFGRDGRLYLGLGDGGPVGHPGNRGQDLTTRLGKLLRIDVDRRGARWHVVGYGLRYPWRFSFDRVTGDLYLADRGERDWEEVDVRRRGELGALANYGWPHYEGLATHKSTPLNPRGELVLPVVVHPHREGDPREACLITGGYVYRGSAVPAARGRYVYGDAYTSEVWSLRISGGKATDVRREPIKIPNVSTFGEDARGELYVAAPRQGRIYKLTS